MQYSLLHFLLSAARRPFSSWYQYPGTSVRPTVPHGSTVVWFDHLTINSWDQLATTAHCMPSFLGCSWYCNPFMTKRQWLLSLCYVLGGVRWSLVSGWLIFHLDQSCIGFALSTCPLIVYIVILPLFFNISIVPIAHPLFSSIFMTFFLPVMELRHSVACHHWPWVHSSKSWPRVAPFFSSS